MDSLTLWDYSDRELLILLQENTDRDTGYVRTKDLAEILGVTGERANQCVGARLAWLRRYGAVTKHPRRSMWAVTEIGQVLISGDLSRAEQLMLADAEDDRLLMVTRFLAKRLRSAGDTASDLMKREWKRNTTSRRY